MVIRSNIDSNCGCSGDGGGDDAVKGYVGSDE